MAKHPAIFLDRDGTIVEDRGYIKDPLDMVFYPESFKALSILQEHFLLFYYHKSIRYIKKTNNRG